MSILHDIIAHKKQEVLEAHSDPQLLAVCSGALPSDRSFIKSLRSRKPSLIAEIKPKSPSAGELIRTDQVPSMLDIYNNHAQAISVLCDHKYFGGGYNLLQTVRHLTDLPILAKEFIIDPLQIDLARCSGADAILLIANVLTKGEIKKLSQCALRHSMSILLELHDEHDIEKIPDIDPDQLMLGINNRSLATMKIDLEVTKKIAARVRSRYADHLIISESGIRDRNDMKELSNHADGFLIGTTFLQSSDPQKELENLFPVSKQCLLRDAQMGSSG